MKKQAHGFTLMEMMVVMTIVIALGGASIYSWQSWKQKQQLRQTAYQVRDFLTRLREDANWHNRDHLLDIKNNGKRWCLVSRTETDANCDAPSPWHILSASPEVKLVDMTAGLGFFGLRNTAWPGHIRLRNESGEWRIIVSTWGRIRACNMQSGAAC
ncbi:prepilin peptidase-dependent protein [Atlantibacter sp.]|uniref:prepilin peptidase-dependent protein n=1 Tax=Atlantibacter sp. TaxID=1903473 RepID=UPI00289FDAC4|nr:prepilin peptidase-dependent protein [Atlantibacter sp.]